MSKKDKSEQGIQESDNQAKLIPIQDAAKQLEITISEFLTYVKVHHIERKSKVKEIPTIKEMLTIGACVGKQKFYRLTEDDLQQFINHKDNMRKHHEANRNNPVSLNLRLWNRLRAQAGA